MKNEDQKQNVLIVDDVPSNIAILEEGLGADYQISFATSGQEALEIARSTPLPDLILMDILMPGMDGYEVCMRLKADKKTRNIPIIFITGKNQKDYEAKGLQLGAVDYVSKPFSMGILKARLRNHLELKAAHDELKEANKRLGLAYAQMRNWKDQLGMQLHGEEMGFLVDENGYILGITEKVVEGTGRMRIELLGSNLLGLADEDSRQDMKAAIREAWVSGFCQVSVGASAGKLGGQAFEAKLMNINMENGKLLLVLMRRSAKEAMP